ncbi:hypothetical protein Lesp02_78800 [Lentzea sp. NBRC 105346]|nr:hypothetical protein Lesp02_78800 [Lentzea sp. NBRC 105346]
MVVQLQGVGVPREVGADDRAAGRADDQLISPEVYTNICQAGDYPDEPADPGQASAAQDESTFIIRHTGEAYRYEARDLPSFQH